MPDSTSITYTQAPAFVEELIEEARKIENWMQSRDLDAKEDRPTIPMQWDDVANLLRDAAQALSLFTEPTDEATIEHVRRAAIHVRDRFMNVPLGEPNDRELMKTYTMLYTILGRLERKTKEKV